MTTIAASIRTHLINADITSVGTKIYRDMAPPSTEYPYMTYFDQLNDRVVLQGDSRTKARNMLIQFDLWQKRMDEDSSIADEISSALEQITITGGSPTVFACNLYDVQRIVEFDDDIIHHAFTLNVYRKV